MNEALDHLETKAYELYDQRIFKIEMEVWIRKFLVQKGEVKSRFKVVFIGNKFWQRSVAGPLKSRPAPLKLRGPPFIIKGAAQL
jgi:hypothetical protein